jgi:hypothetical protein
VDSGVARPARRAVAVRNVRRTRLMYDISICTALTRCVLSSWKVDLRERLPQTTCSEYGLLGHIIKQRGRIIWFA